MTLQECQAQHTKVRHAGGLSQMAICHLLTL